MLPSGKDIREFMEWEKSGFEGEFTPGPEREVQEKAGPSFRAEDILEREEKDWDYKTATIGMKGEQLLPVKLANWELAPKGFDPNGDYYFGGGLVGWGKKLAYKVLTSQFTNTQKAEESKQLISQGWQKLVDFYQTAEVGEELKAAGAATLGAVAPAATGVPELVETAEKGKIGKVAGGAFDILRGVWGAGETGTETIGGTLGAIVEGSVKTVNFVAGAALETFQKFADTAEQMIGMNKTMRDYVKEHGGKVWGEIDFDPIEVGKGYQITDELVNTFLRAAASIAGANLDAVQFYYAPGTAKEKELAIQQGWEENKMLYTELVRPAVEAQYETRLLAGEDPVLLAMELQDPYAELVGELIFDPLNLIAPLARAAKFAKNVNTATDLGGVTDKAADVLKALGKAETAAQSSKHLDDLADAVIEYGYAKKGDGVLPRAIRPRVFKATALDSRGMQLQQLKKMTVNSTWAAAEIKQKGGTPGEVAEWLGNVFKLSSKDRNEVKSAIAYLNGAVDAPLPYFGEQMLETSHLLRNFSDDIEKTIAKIQKGSWAEQEAVINALYKNALDTAYPSVVDMHKAAIRVKAGSTAAKDIAHAEMFKELRPGLVALAEFENTISKPFRRINAFFSNIYFFTYGFAVRNLLTDDTMIFKEAGLKAWFRDGKFLTMGDIEKNMAQIYPGGLPEALKQVSLTKSLDLSETEMTLYQAMTGKKGLYQMIKESKISPQSLNRLIEAKAGMRVHYKFWRDTMESMIEVGRGLPPMDEWQKLGYTPAMVGSYIDILRANNYDVRATKRIFGKLHSGGIETFRDLTWVPDRVKTAMKEFGGWDNLVNFVSDTEKCKSQEDVSRFLREMTADAMQRAGNVSKEVHGILKNHPDAPALIETMQGKYEEMSDGFKDAQMHMFNTRQRAVKEWSSALEDAGQKVTRAYGEAIRVGDENLANELFDLNRRVQSFPREMIKHEDIAYKTIREQKAGLDKWMEEVGHVYRYNEGERKVRWAKYQTDLYAARQAQLEFINGSGGILAAEVNKKIGDVVDFTGAKKAAIDAQSALMTAAGKNGGVFVTPPPMEFTMPGAGHGKNVQKLAEYYGVGGKEPDILKTVNKYADVKPTATATSLTFLPAEQASAVRKVIQEAYSGETVEAVEAFMAASAQSWATRTGEDASRFFDEFFIAGEGEYFPVPGVKAAKKPVEVAIDVQDAKKAVSEVLTPELQQRVEEMRKRLATRPQAPAVVRLERANFEDLLQQEWFNNAAKLRKGNLVLERPIHVLQMIPGRGGQTVITREVFAGAAKKYNLTDFEDVNKIIDEAGGSIKYADLKNKLVDVELEARKTAGAAIMAAQEQRAVRDIKSLNAMQEAFKTTNIDKFVDNISSIGLRTMDAEQIGLVEKWQGYKPGELHAARLAFEEFVITGSRDAKGLSKKYEDAQKMFARGYKAYLLEGKPPVKELEPLFDQIKKWLGDIYRQLKGSDVDILVPDEVKKIYDNLSAPTAKYRSLDDVPLDVAETAFSRHTGNEMVDFTGRLKKRGTEAIIPGEILDDTKGLLPVAPTYIDGAVPSEARAWMESKDELRKVLNYLEDGINKRFGRRSVDIADPKKMKALDKFDKAIAEKVSEAKLAAEKVGNQYRDLALNAYGETTPLDTAAGFLYPYQFWYSRTYGNWMKSLVTNSDMLAAYGKFKDAMAQIYREQPEWYKYQVKFHDFLGINKGNPIMFNLEASIWPLQGITGVDFNDPEKRTNWFTSMIDDLGKFGPSTWTPISLAIGAYYHNKGEVDIAAKWGSRLIPQTALVKAVTALFGNPIELDPNVQFFSENDYRDLEAADPYEEGRITRALSTLEMEGNYTKEELTDAAYTHEGPIWHEVYVRATQARAVPQIMSSFLGAGFKPRTQNDIEIDNFYNDLAKMRTLHDAELMSDEDYRTGFDVLRHNYPFMDVLLLSRRSGMGRENAYAWNVIHRIPPGTIRNEVYKAAGIDPEIAQKFYDSGGKTTGLSETEKARFIAGIVDIGAILAIPSDKTKAEWDQAKAQSDRVYAALKDEFGDDILDKMDAYFAEDDKNKKKLYLETNPDVAAALDRKDALVIRSPLLSKYYGGIDTLERYYTSKMYDDLEKQFGADVLDAAREYSSSATTKERKRELQSKYNLYAYWKEKARLKEQNMKAIVRLGSKIPEVSPEYREVEGELPAMQKNLQELQQPAITFDQWSSAVGPEMTEHIVAYWNTNTPLTDWDKDELDYLARQYNMYDGNELLQTILLSLEGR